MTIELPTPPRRGRGRPPGKAPRAVDDPAITVRSEGQRLLLVIAAPVKQVAAVCGVTEGAVVDWRQGRCNPSAALRALLWAAYEIPAPSWGVTPAGQNDSKRTPGPVAPPPVSPPVLVPSSAELEGRGDNGHGATPDADRAPLGALDETGLLLAQIRGQLARTDMLAGDRARVTDTYTKTLALQHRLQKESDLTEDRIIRDHPTWRRIRGELARVLARYPDVAAEVCEALERLGM